MSKYMFENKQIDGMTWNQLHDGAASGRLLCYKECSVEKAGDVYKLEDPASGEVCYVFLDEAEQFSNPYRTVEEAAKMSRLYADHL